MHICPHCLGALTPPGAGEQAQLELCTCPGGPLWGEILTVIPETYRLAAGQRYYPDRLHEYGDIPIFNPQTYQYETLPAAKFRHLAIVALRYRNKIRQDLIDAVIEDGLRLPCTFNRIAQVELDGGSVNLKTGAIYPRPQQPAQQPARHTATHDRLNHQHRRLLGR